MDLEKMNKPVKTTAATAGTFAMLKAMQNTADPYTRIAIGGVLGIGSFAFGGREIGLGVWLGAGLQGFEILKGGRITRNNYDGVVYALHEEKGVIAIKPKQIPDGNFDGLTIAGTKSVFKISDGVYCKITRTGNISETFGLGKLVNTIKNAGYKNYNWCNKQADKRWMRLYNHSL